MKICSTPIVVRAIKAKTHNETPQLTIRMNKVKMVKSTKWCWRFGVTGTLVHCWRDFKMENSLVVSCQILLIQPSHFLINIYPREIKAHIYTETWTLIFITVLFIRAKLEIAQMSVLVYLGCYNKTPLTGWLINNKLSLLAVLEARKSKVKVLAHSVSGGKGCFLVQGQSTEESINEFVIVLERNSRRQ